MRVQFEVAPCSVLVDLYTGLHQRFRRICETENVHHSSDRNGIRFGLRGRPCVKQVLRLLLRLEVLVQRFITLTLD